MKLPARIFATLIISVLLISSLSITGSAAVADWSAVTLEEFIIIMNSYVETSDNLLENGQYSMRGFAVSPDGKYAFGGFLNPTGTSAVNMFDLDTAVPIGSYIHDQADGGRSYPKSLATDDRGYLYVGLTYQPNYGSVDFSVVKYTSSGEMTEISYTNIVKLGTPGDSSATKIGINGAAVQKIGTKYYAYFVTNYDADFLYRFDVTDPAKPVLDTSFGDGGRIDLAGKHSFVEGQYLDVDTDGTIYLCGSKTGESGMYRISDDGKTALGEFKCTNAYSSGLWEDYIFVTSSSGPSSVHVLDKTTLTEIATIPAHSGANMYAYVTAVGGILYVADQCSGVIDFDGIIVAPLTTEGAETLNTRKAAIAAATPDTEPETEPTTPDTDAPGTDSPGTTGDTDDTDNSNQTAGNTKAQSEDDSGTTGDNGGCGSALTATFLPALLCVSLPVFKKNRKRRNKSKME